MIVFQLREKFQSRQGLFRGHKNLHLGHSLEQVIYLGCFLLAAHTHLIIRRLSPSRLSRLLCGQLVFVRDLSAILRASANPKEKSVRARKNSEDFSGKEARFFPARFHVSVIGKKLKNCEKNFIFAKCWRDAALIHANIISQYADSRFSTPTRALTWPCQRVRDYRGYFGDRTGESA